MLFNSLQFAIFFFILYSLYVFLDHKWQNRLLLLASYIFYGAWDWRFLSLIFISTLLDYFCGLKIFESKDRNRQRLFLLLSVCGNLSILGFFKYYNFFAYNLQTLLSYFDITVAPHFLNIILPVGISFYTFQTMSYTIDIYKGQMQPTRKFPDFALFVAFFPQLIAGPIERAKHLLPQMLHKRKLTFEKFKEGAYLIFWGLFQKVFVADNLAKIVDPIFKPGASVGGMIVLLGTYAFAFQVLCDFSGYSNIARGLGKCMGFDIMINFNLPYFATNPKEFWRRWHISLSTWLRDYVYIPLGGNRLGKLRTYLNIFTTMTLCGLWHGAAWTFIFWGVYQAILLIVHKILSPFLGMIKLPSNKITAGIWYCVRLFFFFNIMCIGMMIFRVQSMGQLYRMLNSMLFNISFTPEVLVVFKDILYLISFMLIVQIIQYRKQDVLAILKSPVWLKTAFVLVIIGLYIHNMIYGKYSWIENGQEFIYFQF